MHPLAPHLRDHAFADEAVFPAVEAMRVLADAVAAFRGEMAPDGPEPAGDDAPAVVIREARFEKFLPLPADAASVEVIRQITPRTDGSVEAALLTRRAMGKSGMIRRLEHARMIFADRRVDLRSSGEAPPAEWPIPRNRGNEENEGFAVPADRLYAELVPFGPAFRNIVGEALLYPDRAEALVRAPLSLEVEDRSANRSHDLGSPFPLDAAFHAACAWSQRHAGVVAFPVGFAERRIIHPIAPGETVRSFIVPRGAEGGVLRFDLFLMDEGNALRETVTGLLMRDVSQGRWRPPEWIRFSREER